MAEEPKTNGEQLVQRNEKGQVLPGVVLNPAGRPKGSRHMTTLLEEAIKKVAEGDAEPADIQIVRKVIEKAKAGEFKHTELIWDRLEGKAPQEIKLENTSDTETNAKKIEELSAKFDEFLKQSS